MASVIVMNRKELNDAKKELTELREKLETCKTLQKKELEVKLKEISSEKLCWIDVKISIMVKKIQDNANDSKSNINKMINEMLERIDFKISLIEKEQEERDTDF